MNKKSLVLLILFSLSLKAGYLLFSYIHDQAENPQSISRQYIDADNKNDAGWYQKIARNGYSEIEERRALGYSEGGDFKQSEWAFFPLYPAINAFVMRFLNLDFDWSAFLLSLIFSTLALIGMYRFGVIYFQSESIAFFSAMILFAFPFSYYYSMFYTEALFFTFAIYSFICIYQRRYWLLSVLLIPLVLIRPNGIVLLIPLYLFHLERNGLLKNYSPEWNKLFGGRNLLRSFAFLSAPIAFLLYGWYQFEMTGYFFAFSIAQSGWYKEFMFPLLAFFRREDLTTQFNSFYTIVLIAYALWIWRKLPFSLNTMIWISLLLPLCSGSVVSMPRYISVIFPLFLIFGKQLFSSRHKYLWLLLLLILHFTSYYPWLISHPLGY